MVSMPIELEKDIEQAFVEWVKMKGGLTYKWEGSRRKLDRIVVANGGKIFFVEFKKPGGRLTAHQKKIVNELQYHDAPHLVTDNLKEAKQYYREQSACQ